jgi:seryl-tRNA synthetase
MLDIDLIRKSPERVKDLLKRKSYDVNFDQFFALDEKRRALIAETETLRARRNQVSGDIPKLKKQGVDTQPLMNEMKEVGDRIKAIEVDLATVEGQVRAFLEVLPNVPDEDLPAGGKEGNQTIRVWGEKPNFSFAPKHHVDLVNHLGIVDYERGVKIGGTNFWLYRGDGAIMEWALLNFFIEEHLKANYEFILPPHLLNVECGYTAGQFPKFAADVFHLRQPEETEFKHFLLPTAETALVNFYRDEIVDEAELPRRMFAYTPCYRREAGSHGASERGMIRGHQFNKVELFAYTRPEDSDKVHEELVGKAEDLVKKLGLHHRVVKLAAGDCSHAMARTYDIEVWIPSMNEYKEVSSASNARCYQARRGNLRFRRKETKRVEFMHTLNASGLATSRIFPAIMEQYQRADGSVTVPEVLRKWVGKEVLLPVAR